MKNQNFKVSISINIICFILFFNNYLNAQSKKGDGPPVTRTQIILTADKYARVHWTMSEKNRTGKNSNKNFKSNYRPGKRIGMGYKWGGWDSIEEFLDRIEKGYGAGTGGGGNYYRNFSKNDVTGISCTGLVSRAWYLEHKYTLNYSSPFTRRKFQEISHDLKNVDFKNNKIESLRKGDAFINVHHIILFVYKRKDGKLRVIDSSTPGVTFRTIKTSYLNKNGYKAIRYNNIIETEDPQGTINNPIKINELTQTFIADGNTRDIVSMEFDSYSSDPKSSQVGPEVIYELNISQSGNIEIEVTGIKKENIDNDIHLLHNLKKSNDGLAINCIASNDNRIEQLLEKGKYYIIVDSNDDKPGEFTLSVKLK